MEPQEINSLCRLCGTFSNNMIDVLSEYQDKPLLKNQSNILEIIHNCLPVQVYKLINLCMCTSSFPNSVKHFQISNFDGLPKAVCESCCDKSRNVYEFIQLILTTQKMFLKNLDNVELIKTNKNKVVQRFAQGDTEKSVNIR